MKYLLPLMCLALLMGSCRTHKESVSSASLSQTEEISALSQEVRYQEVFESILKSISMDSLEIIIQRTWINPEITNPQFMATPDSMRVSEKILNSETTVSESITIRAKNVAASLSSESHQSAKDSLNLYIQDVIETDIQTSDSYTTDRVQIFDPPNVLEVVIWSFAIGAAILLLVCIIKRKE